LKYSNKSTQIIDSKLPPAPKGGEKSPLGDLGVVNRVFQLLINYYQMKNIVQKVFLLLLIVFSSCSSIHRFTIEVQEPAAVTLPVSAQNVLILNNTIVQPIDYGIERNFDGNPIQADYPLSLDSMVWISIDEISDVLDKSDFFNKVAVYKEPVRNDTEWLSVVHISPEQQEDFYDIEDFNALFVVERLLFKVREDVMINKGDIPYYEPVAFVDMRVDGIITCSMYAYGKSSPVTTFNLHDSIFTKSMVFNDTLFLFKDIPEILLGKLSRNFGAQAAKCFIPEWKQVDRFLFVGHNSRMQEAAGYANNYKWINAESIWKTQLEKNNKSSEKAKIAYNLAIANEMQDKIEPALEWALKSKGYLKNVNTDKYSRETELIEKYILELGQRIQKNRLLDLQWGK